MSLHFLLKAEARVLSLVEVLGLKEADAFALFRRMSWGEVEVDAGGAGTRKTLTSIVKQENQLLAHLFHNAVNVRERTDVAAALRNNWRYY